MSTATMAGPRANASLHVGVPGPSVVLESAALLNSSLGAGYVDATALAELATGGILVRARGKRGQLVGAATARVLTPAEAAAVLEKIPASDFLAGHRIGELKSSAVIPAARGRGIGTGMLQVRLAFLKAAGCRYAVTASWVSADAGHASLHLLERAGFTALATVPGYWADDQTIAGYACPDCGGKCRCTATIMILDLAAR